MKEFTRQKSFSFPSILGLSFTVIALLKFSCSLGLPFEQSVGLAEHLKQTLLVYVIEFIVYFASLIYLFRSLKLKINQQESATQSFFSTQALDISQPNRKQKSTQFGVKPWMLYLFLLLSRVAWWTAPPSASEDVWRYLWDGERVYQAESVYTLAPSQIQLSMETVNDHTRQEIKNRIGHAEIPTVYPPSAQLIFAFSTILSNAIESYVIKPWCTPMSLSKQSILRLKIKLIIWRILLLLADLAILAVLISICRVQAYSLAPIIIYALSPLIAFESSLAGHLDLFGIAFMLLSLRLTLNGRQFMAGTLLGVAILIKFIPSFLLISLIMLKLKNQYFVHLQTDQDLEFKHRHMFENIGLYLLGLLSSVLILCLPFLSELISFHGVWPGLKAYSTHWSFNGSIYPLLQTLIDVYLLPHNWELSRLLTKGTLGVCLMMSTVIYAFKLKPQSKDLFRVLNQVILFALSGLFFCSPVVFTWYLQWLIPFIVLAVYPYQAGALHKYAESKLCIILVLWSFLANLTYIPRYELLCGKDWRFNVLWTMLEYGILALTLLLIKGYSLYYSHEVGSNK